MNYHTTLQNFGSPLAKRLESLNFLRKYPSWSWVHLTLLLGCWWCCYLLVHLNLQSFMSPAGIYFWIYLWNLFNLTLKETKTAFWISFGGSFVNFRQISHLIYYISIRVSTVHIGAHCTFRASWWLRDFGKFEAFI